MGGQRIVITDEEAKEIERKQLIVKALNHAGALEIYNGSFTAHFDSDGKIRRVDRNDTIYKV